MFDKIIAFQNMLLRTTFSGSVDIIHQPLKNRKLEIITLIISFTLTYFVGNTLFRDLMSSMVIPLIVLPRLYSLLSKNENMIFHLPIKRSFIILNIFIFSILISQIFSLLLLWVYDLATVIPLLISALFGNAKQLAIVTYDIAYLQERILTILYAVIYVNVITVSFFAKKIKFRIAIPIIFTSIYSVITLYIYRIIPKAPNQSYYSLKDSLLLLPNSWIYVTIALCVAIIVTLGGIFIAIRLDRAKIDLQNCHS